MPASDFRSRKRSCELHNTLWGMVMLAGIIKFAVRTPKRVLQCWQAARIDEEAKWPLNMPYLLCPGVAADDARSK